MNLGPVGASHCKPNAEDRSQTNQQLKIETYFEAGKIFAFAKHERERYFAFAMSTLAEIQDAVARLPGAERKALQIWLNSQAEPEMSPEEEAQLLRSIDQAISDIDTGKGLVIDEVRRQVGSWVGR